MTAQEQSQQDGEGEVQVQNLVQMGSRCFWPTRERAFSSELWLAVSLGRSNG